ncbi:asparagine synthase (glutamine-hydrolysing) [Tamilnaduibacter salinus]|uniref:asparagine synthase (glutamine-hydrolyzing) n=1 Tax=Tamilnaduibacter salinus TaxID=1484056 RepID=A0A2U1CZU3_9GAMM|nr:asparagine synthase (glutamine-hydrolyzing) [Tamilnaduibacter salinus]PVY78315.1 asparagine synthase (glutamine-hydrolysing) [Tamilnaduibacter salinus]
MCGIAGFLRTNDTPNRDAHRDWLEAMGQAIRHRGPDAGGVYLDDGVGLSHRRLSILDLSEAGNQPMVSASGRYVIVFNGEIYNFPDLKTALVAEGVSFRTHTDTEVLLELFERRGPDCLQDLNGMFAIAIWDTQDRRLFLARDRLGKKPLYYYRQSGQFAFASEIKALQQAPFVTTTLRPDAIKDFFFYQYVPDPKSIYRDVHKLAPGHWMWVTDREVETHRYWDVRFRESDSRTESEWAEGLRDTLADAVRLRLVSDVPVGAFLSGGVDSSAIVDLMASQSPEPVTTCSIGFDSERFDEVTYAEKVARQYGTNHHEFTVRETVSDHLTEIARYFDEPFADPSFIPTYYVSQLARQQVTVALAGDGGDENFAGYGKYRVDALENRLRRCFPHWARSVLFPGLAGMAGRFRQPVFRRARSLLNTLACDPATGFYISNRFCDPAVWDYIAGPALRRDTDGYDPADLTRYHYRRADTDDHLSRVLYSDFKTYLPGDILVKVDRMSMAHSLETRAPLLDYRVVEYAASVPSQLKLRGSEGKYLLKKAFEGRLTDETLYRKKMGFSVPLAEWLRTEIRPLAELILTTEKGGLGDFFRMPEVRTLWERHVNGSDRYTQELWTLIAFSLWFDNYGG